MENFVKVVVSQSSQESGNRDNVGISKKALYTVCHTVVQVGRQHLYTAHFLYFIFPLFRDGYLSEKHDFCHVGWRLAMDKCFLTVLTFYIILNLIVKDLVQIAKHSHVFSLTLQVRNTYHFFIYSCLCIYWFINILQETKITQKLLQLWHSPIPY